MKPSSNPRDGRDSLPKSRTQTPSNRDEIASEQDRLRQLLSDCCDNGWDSVRAGEIEKLLTQTPELVEDYTNYLVNESLVEQACGLTVFDVEGRGAGNVAAEVGLGGKPIRVPWAMRIVRHPSWAVAALVLATVTLSLAIWAKQPLATVIAAIDARLANGSEVRLGEDMGEAWIDLEHGSVHLALREGAMVAIQAPARFRAVDGNVAELRRGAISVHVPASAHGFTVLNRVARIIDLGTGYRAVADLDGTLSVHVTQGSVRVDPVQGEAISLEAGGIVAVPNGSGPRTIDATRQRPRFGGQFRFSDEHPESLGYGAFVNNGVAHAFLESHAVRLQDDLRVDLFDAGRHRDFQPQRKAIGAGTVIDCYLIHCAPQQRRHEVKGSIRFTNKIVGVLCNDDRLNATNEVLGTGWTLACQHAERGVESAPDPNSDTITISADRRRLTAHFRTMSIDQLRVLVASEHTR